MTREVWRDVGAGVAYSAVGFTLYLFVTSLGTGGGAGRGATATTSPRLKDEKRLTFVMIAPTIDDSLRPMSFRSRDEASGARVYSLQELIDRVKTGGRSDVLFKIAGNVRAGSAQSALDLVKQAGIEVWKEEAGGARVAGNARGQYGS